jgi:predicted house-cleaning noncanonical NTP pyrophosphatase (MazG superfamily)
MKIGYDGALTYTSQDKGMMRLNGLRNKYQEIRAVTGARPTRVMMYLKLGKGFHDYLREGWLAFLAGVGDLTPEEGSFLGTVAEEFLAGLEKTVFDKAYKIPVILAFLERGKVRSAVTLSEIGKVMMDFYQGSEEHQLDLHDKRNQDWREWGSTEFAALALEHTIRSLQRSMEKFFRYDEHHQVFWLRNLDGYLDRTLAGHIRDIMEYRRLRYFRSHYGVDPDDLGTLGIEQAAGGAIGHEGAGDERVRVYHKLIRDRIPEIIVAQGKSCVVRTLTEEEYRAALDRKLREELAEYLAAGTVEELADLVEVALALAKVKGLTEEEFERVRLEKKEERGGFEKRLWLSKVEE